MVNRVHTVKYIKVCLEVLQRHWCVNIVSEYLQSHQDVIYLLFFKLIAIFYQVILDRVSTFNSLTINVTLRSLFVLQLEEVMEKETYKAAKDLLDKYDPNSEIVKVQ